MIRRYVTALRLSFMLVDGLTAALLSIARVDVSARARVQGHLSLGGDRPVCRRSTSDEQATLDLAYIDRWSLWLDLRIIARTIPALVTQPGK